MKLHYILDVTVDLGDSSEDETEERITEAVKEIGGVTDVEVMDVQ